MGKFVAIEIGNELTKVLYGFDKKEDIVIKDYRFIRNTDKLFNPDGELNINEIQPLLKSELKDMGIRRADCYLTVGGQSGIVRLREMPLVRLKEMKEIVRFEAEQFLPYNVEAFYIDYRVNRIIDKPVQEGGSTDESQTDTQTAEVMIVAAPKELIDDQIELIDKLRLNIKRVDYYTDAVFCYFRKHILSDDKNVLVVDLGSAGMKMTMFNGTKYFANISSELGVKELITRYTEKNNVSESEARKHLLPPNVHAKKEETSLILNRLETLRQKMQFSKASETSEKTTEYDFDPELELLYEPIGYEVGKMMEFFKTRQFGMSVDALYLIGGGSNLNQLNEFLRVYHNIDVLKVENIAKDSDMTDHEYALMVPVIGSLVKGGC